LILTHGGDLAERLGGGLLIGADLSGVSPDGGLGLRLVANLPDEPVRDVAPGDSDPRSRVPQPTAEASLEGWPLGGRSPEDRVRVVAVAPPLVSVADDGAAESTEVARFGDGGAIDVRDDRRHARRLGELVLEALDDSEVEEIREADLRELGQLV